MKQLGRGRWLMGCAVVTLIIVGAIFTFSRVVILWYTSVLDHWTYGDALVYTPAPI